MRALLVRDRVGLALVVTVAALARFPSLVVRGEFDGDQAHDMLVLWRLVHEGVVPLLGPPTSIGDFHHGAFYYYLLAPAAVLSGADPTVVVGWIALLGIAAVAATWWVARAMGGPIAGLAAGLLLAVSPAAVDESTFIWNPDPIPLFAALALGCAWRAWSARSTHATRWWAAAFASTGVVVQLHVLGVVFVPIVLGLWVAALLRVRRRPAAGAEPGRAGEERRLVWGLIAGTAVVALLYVPLLVHELGSGFEETRHALDYLRGGHEPAVLSPLGRIAFALLRVVGWPLVGLVTDVPVVSILVLAVVAPLAVLLALRSRGPSAVAVRWLVLGVVWGAVALAFAAPSLQTVVAGLPNDHYHAFLDPVVAIVVGLIVAGPWGPGARLFGWTLAVAWVGLVGIAIARWPAFTDPHGGWPAAEAAGRRIAEVAAGDRILVRGVPTFKTPELAAFPAVRAGATLADAEPGADAPLPDPSQWDGAAVVIVCDRLFERVVGKACGGAAEDDLVAGIATAIGRSAPSLVDRFDLSAREVISIYRR